MNLEGQIYPTPPNTPGSSISDKPGQYVEDAKHHIGLAQEYERNKDYENAFTEYKAAIEVLLEHVKGRALSYM